MYVDYGVKGYGGGGALTLTMAAMTTGNMSELPEFLASCATFKMLVPSFVAMDQLLCLPDPFTP